MSDSLREEAKKFNKNLKSLSLSGTGYIQDFTFKKAVEVYLEHLPSIETLNISEWGRGGNLSNLPISSANLRRLNQKNKNIKHLKVEA